MSQHFRYGYTLEAAHLSANQQSDSMDGLFNIGNHKLVTDNIIQDKNIRNSRSRSRTKKKNKKKNKQLESQKHKKHKKSKKQKKQKKQKKKYRTKSDSQEQEEIVISSRQEEDQKAINKLEIVLKQKLDTHENNFVSLIQQENQNAIEIEQFMLKYKISRKSLPIDIIHFGEVGLQKYGLRDSDIPVYKRPIQHNSIIGWFTKSNNKSHKSKKPKKPKLKDINQMKRILHELNIIINQKDSKAIKKRQEQNGSINRYFHFEGYHDIVGENLVGDQYVVGRQQTENTENEEYESHKFIPIQEKMKGYSRIQNRLLSLGKQYNSKISQQPKNQKTWIQFIQLQQITYNHHHNSISFMSNNKSEYQYHALLDRKLSIIEKARNNLPNSYWLMLMDFIATDQIKKQKKQLTKLLQPKLNVIQKEVSFPHTIEYFLLYLKINISAFAKYSHTYLLSQYEHIKNQYLDYAKKNVYSTKKIQEIRFIQQQITHEVLRVIQKEGYQRLVISVVLANLEIALFRKQRSIDQYRQFYEEYKYYKLGQCPSSCWNNPIKVKDNTEVYFPNKYHNLVKSKDGLNMPQFLSLHPYFHQSYIDDNPSSFLLFDDIKPFLTAYRNKSSIQKTLDFLCELLRLPYVYSHTLSQTLTHNWLKQSLFCENSEQVTNKWNFILWNKYWAPLLTNQFITKKMLQTILYFINILETVQQQIQNKPQDCFNINIYPIRQYLLFLYCVFYCEDKLHKYMLPDNSSAHIKNIFAKFSNQQGYLRDHYYCRAWAIYANCMMEFKKSSFEQGLCCLYSCNQGVSPKIINKLQALYWINMFLDHHNIRLNGMQSKNLIVFLLKLITSQQKLPQYSLILSLDTNISQMDTLLTANTLKDILTNIANQTLPQYLLNYYRTIVYSFLLILGQNPNIILQKIVPRIVINSKKDTDYGIGRLFMVDLLIQQNILNIQKMRQLSILRLQNNGLRVKPYINMKLIDCWLRKNQISSVSVKLLMIENQYNFCKQGQFNLFGNAIVFKLIVSRFLQNQVCNNNGISFQHYQQVILKHIKQRFQQKHPIPIYHQKNPSFLSWRVINTSPTIQIHHQSKEIQLLNILIKDPQFALQNLDKLPYCRQLYRIVAQRSLDSGTREKIFGSILEKQIANL